MVLPDTSVWVEFLRRGERGRAAALRRLINQGEVLVCGPVAAELIAGTGESGRDSLLKGLRAIRWANLDRAAWLAVGDAAASLRKSGRTLPLTDLAIAVAASRADATLWTYDGDFERPAEVIEGLRVVDRV